MNERKPTARSGQCTARMAEASSVQMEDRNILRRMERERRSQEVQQEETQYDSITPLFSEPFKRIKGDELSSRIQRMLGNYEDGCDAGPTELLLQNPLALPYGQFPRVDDSKVSLHDSSRLERPCVSVSHEGETWGSLPVLCPPADPLSPLQSSDSGSEASPERIRSTRRPDAPPLTLPLNLHCKLANAKKPTAYVRPMDGQDQVTSDSPQLKASPESREYLQNLKESSKAALTPLQSVDIESHECVKDILQEMTSWPPLLTSIHTPNTAKPLKLLSSTEESCGLVAVKSHVPSESIQLEPQGRSSYSSESDSSSDTDSEKSISPDRPAAAETTRTHLTITNTQAGSDCQLGRWLERRENPHQQNPGSPCDVISYSSQNSSVGIKTAGQQGGLISPNDGGKDVDCRQTVGSTYACENVVLENKCVEISQNAEMLSTDRPKHKRKKTVCRSEQKRTTTTNDSASKQTWKRTRQPLLVKIQLNQLSRIPREPKTEPSRTSESSGRKRAAEVNEKSPKKKQKVDKKGKRSSSSQHSQSEAVRNIDTTTMMKKKKSKNGSSPPREELQHRSTTALKSQQKKAETHGKKTCKSRSVPEKPCLPADKPRALLLPDHRQRSVEDHMKEAKKLKHKADATPDKTAKALIYLEAALAFVESGIAMETEPQTPKSAYTMFSETLDLIRFILKLKNYTDPSAVAHDRDFFILSLRCQSLLQMAMFRYRRDSALQYSQTLTEHFKSSSLSAFPSVSKSAVASPIIPQPLQQVMASYISITALFLSAHEIWEQADELAHTGSGLLRELDSVLGPLSLTSSVCSLVRYTRHGLQRIRRDLR